LGHPCRSHVQPSPRESRWFRFASSKARLARDTALRDAFFGEAVDAFLQGDSETGKAVLRDLINGTVGFEKLARRIRRIEIVDAAAQTRSVRLHRRDRRCGFRVSRRRA